MSTVLDALRERDGGGTSSASDPLTGRVHHHRIGWVWPAVGLGLACAAALPLVRATWWAEVVAPPPRPAPAASAPPIEKAVEPVTPAVRPRSTVPIGEAPRARIGPWTSPEPAAPAAPRPPQAPPGPAVAPAPSQGATAASAAPAVEHPAPPAATRAVHLESIRYGTGPAERAATLVIDGATPVTLRQGESAGDVEVQLVLPQAVYVRRGGEVFALGELR